MGKTPASQGRVGASRSPHKHRHASTSQFMLLSDQDQDMRRRTQTQRTKFPQTHNVLAFARKELNYFRITKAIQKNRGA